MKKVCLCIDGNMPSKKYMIGPIVLIIINLKFLGSYYKCNSYDEKNEKKSVEGSRASLERYLFYYNRYANHQNSLNLEKDLYNKVKEKMDELQLLNMTWIEVYSII